METTDQKDMGGRKQEAMNVEMRRATLVLDDGTRFEGRSFGHPSGAAGEVVFNTAMTGYPESLTDPSYRGQIIVTTSPMLGNYGVPADTPDSDDSAVSRYYESDRIHARAIICQDYSAAHNHWQATRSLAEWLNEQGVTGVTGIDTRALTKHLREHGSMLGRILVEGAPEPEAYDPNVHNLVAEVSCREPEVHNPGGEKTVVLVDCGVKHNIIRCLTRRGMRVVRVPWDYDYRSEAYDGLFISNGPGNPDMATRTVEILRGAMADDPKRPVCGICMGNQLLSKAAGATIYKLKYGHRSHNQPVRQAGTNRCFVTSQNHGFAVDDTRLPADWEPLFVNMNDGTNEGIRHKVNPWFSAQFHPEASSGPKDTEFIFDDFVAMVKQR